MVRYDRIQKQWTNNNGQKHNVEMRTIQMRDVRAHMSPDVAKNPTDLPYLIATGNILSEYKTQGGWHQLYDRPNDVMRYIRGLPANEVPNFIASLYFDAQKTSHNRIASFGLPGSFTELAAMQYQSKARQDGTDLGIKHIPTMTGTAEAVSSGKLRYGVIPYHNSTMGRVNGADNLLKTHGVETVSEETLPIVHTLMVNKGVGVRDIKSVISHEQAIGQCKKYLTSLHKQNSGIQITPYQGTAEAAERIKMQEMYNTAVIATRRCADIYGLDVLAHGIQDNDDNRTTFKVFGRGQ